MTEQGPSDAIQAAVQRSQTAMLILDRHKGALEPHLAMLCETFGPDIFRVIVAGAVEGAVVAWRLKHEGAVIPFPEEGQ